MADLNVRQTRLPVSPLRTFWLSLTLVVVCIATFAITYYALAEGKRVQAEGNHGFIWLIGSVVIVTATSLVVLYSTLAGVEEKKKRGWIAIGGSAVVVTTYFYFLMFVVLNTLGS